MAVELVGEFSSLSVLTSWGPAKFKNQLKTGRLFSSAVLGSRAEGHRPVR